MTDGRAVIAEKSGLVWVGTDHEMIAIDPAAVRSKAPLPEKARVAVGQLDFLLASRTGGYWRIADGRIEKCDGHNDGAEFGTHTRGSETRTRSRRPARIGREI